MSKVVKYTLIFFIVNVLVTLLYLWVIPPPPTNRVVFPLMGPIMFMIAEGIIGMFVIGAKYKEVGQGMVLAAGVSLLIGLAVCAKMV